MKSILPYLAMAALLTASHNTTADEKGVGHDIPDAPPSDPAPSETTENPWQELLEWLDTDVEQ